MDEKLKGNVHYMHCRQCVTEKQPSKIEVLSDGRMIQIWCVNHNCNVARFQLHRQHEFMCQGEGHG